MARKSENMQKTIIETLNVIMNQNEKVVVVNADLGLLFKDGQDMSSHPERVFDVGIAEQNMIGTAAGLALSGKIVFTTTIAEMAVARVLEQIRLDACYQNLNINMFGQGRGFAYGIAGSSHVMMEDISMLRAIPNLSIIFPADAVEARKVIQASVYCPGPKYIAFSRGVTETLYEDDGYEYIIGKANTMRVGKDITIIAAGDMVVVALDAAEILQSEGIDACVINMHTIKPLDNNAVIHAAKQTGAIVTVESHNRLGGLGSAVAEVLCEECRGTLLKIMGAEDRFPDVGDEHEILDANGLNAATVASNAKALLKKKS